MFRCIQIFDASGNLLENFENYNDMYTVTELLTNNAANRSGVSTFHGEEFAHPYDVNASIQAGDAGIGKFDVGFPTQIETP